MEKIRKIQGSDPFAQPDEKEWTFTEELQTPIHQKIEWKKRSPKHGEAFFPDGIRVERGFEDPGGLLQTAYDDLNRFVTVAGLRTDGPYRLITRRVAAMVREEYRLIIGKDQCEILANDTEGIRRGLIWIEDEMLKRGGPFLPVGTIRRKPVIRTRISRCFYGPINRPPKCRDELADEVNYYPDEYLNRLAHEGVNGLWLTITFRDTCPSKIIPEYGKDSARRLMKLRQTVERCGRYGIKIYPFCIEPAALEINSPVFTAHPELKGHTDGSGNAALCISAETVKAYVEEATRNLFSEVPGLGGLIVISVGERFTHCYSGGVNINCPRCSKRKPWDVLGDTLAAMARGMHSVNPEAELISWPYSQYLCWGEKLTVEAARHVPKHVILQQNYESLGKNKQLGKWRIALDYWLAYAGPSRLFRDCTAGAVRHGNRMFAKLQVGCSHEVATVPCVPVPGILYKKYRTMHRIGVSGAMQCWYFGNYPSIMTKAAGELSFAPFPATEKGFLLDLARRDWQKDAPEVVKAWQYFQKGYAQYPTSCIFGYYGPMHDGPVWPLYLEPRNLPLAPTWLLQFPPSGDCVGECIGHDFTYEEVLTLCTAMARNWNKGVAILKGMASRYKRDPERIKDIQVAIALGLQFQSGLNILNFYALREELAESKNPKRRKTFLNRMRGIVKEELKIDEELLELTEKDSRLGFHSEAEGYKYFPVKIRWRMNQLKELLVTEFPRVEGRISWKQALFPAYVGEDHRMKSYHCKYLPKVPHLDGKPCEAVWENMTGGECEYWAKQYAGSYTTLDDQYREGRKTLWKAGYDKANLYVGVYCQEGNMRELKLADNDKELYRFFRYDCIKLNIVRRLGPCLAFIAAPNGLRRCAEGIVGIDGGNDDWHVFSNIGKDGWSVIIRISFEFLHNNEDNQKKPLKFNIERWSPLPGKGEAYNSWIQPCPLKPRLIWGPINPATDFGRLIFDKRRT